MTVGAVDVPSSTVGPATSALFIAATVALPPHFRSFAHAPSSPDNPRRAGAGPMTERYNSPLAAAAAAAVIGDRADDDDDDDDDD